MKIVEYFNQHVIAKDFDKEIVNIFVKEFDEKFDREVDMLAEIAKNFCKEIVVIKIDCLM